MERETEQEIREQLRQWRRAHPQATFDEIDAEVARQYARLHAAVVAELSLAAEGATGAAEGADVLCPACQTPMQRRGQRRRRNATRRGVEAELARDYYVCPACGAGLFPLDEALGLSGGRGSLQPPPAELAGALGGGSPLCASGVLAGRS